MIIEVRISNMFSFRDEVTLNMTSGGSKSRNAAALSSHVFSRNGYDLLKSVAIYGANASGKSNLVKAIRFCRAMVLNSHNHNENVVFNYMPFKFEGCDGKPSHFYIRFIYGGTEYEYSYSFTRAAILSESLYYYPNGRRSRVFVRDESKGPEKRDIYSFSGAIKRPMDVAVNTSSKTLFVSRASQMDRDVAKDVFRFFNESVKLSPVMEIRDVERLFNTYKGDMLDALRVADSDIVDVSMKREQMHSRQVQIPLHGSPGETVPVNDVEQDILRFTTFHRADPEVPFDMDAEESDGTRRLFMNMLLIIDVLRNDRTLIWDEMDRSLHSKIVEYLIGLFNSGGGVAQLICTVHDTNLLDMNLMRRDQLYFVNKGADGASDLYSLFDYRDFRDTMDAEKAYLQGRFDAIPYIDVSGIKTPAYEE